MADDSGSGSLIAKIAGGIFATVVAPILVALVTRDKPDPPAADPAKPDAVASAAPAASVPDQPNAGQPGSGGSSAGPARTDTAEPDAGTPNADNANAGKSHVSRRNAGKADQLASVEGHPRGKDPVGRKDNAEAGMDTSLVRLFNGIDKTGFYTWLGAKEPKEKGKGKPQPIGKNRDPDKQFSVVDGLLNIGGPVEGGLVTEKEYENYELRVRYRWGEQNWPPNVKRARRGGILLHCTGPDGAIFTSAMRSIRCDLSEGQAGTMRAVGSFPKTPISFTTAAEQRNAGEGEKKEVHYRYSPAKPLTTLTNGVVNQLGFDPNWQNVKGFRGKDTLEKPVGEWNFIECICEGGRITVRLNGTTVNEINDVTLRKGKIMIQALRSEIFIKAINIKPLPSGGPKGKR
jgi:hypothetical protein